MSNEYATKIIDAHQHLVNRERFDYYWTQPWMTPLHRSFLQQDFHETAADLGVVRSVVVQAHPSVEETRYLAELAREEATIGAVVGWVDLTAPDLVERLEAYRDLRFVVAVRDQQAEDKPEDWWRRDEVIHGLQQVAEAGFIYDLLVRSHQLKEIPALFDRVPDLTWILEHLGKPPVSEGALEPWRSDLAAVAANPRVAAKVSGLVVEADHKNWTTEQLAPFVQSAAELFGFERLMWGSDWPVSLLAAGYEAVLRSSVEALGSISERERSAFLHEAASTWYGLSSS